MTAPHNNSPSRFSFAAERRKSTPFLAMSLSFQTRHSLAVLFLADVFVAFATEVTGCWVIRRDHSPPFSQRDRCVFDPASTHKTPASWPPGPALTHLRPTCVAPPGDGFFPLCWISCGHASHQTTWDKSFNGCRGTDRAGHA